MRRYAILITLLSGAWPCLASAQLAPPCLDDRAALADWLNAQPGNITHQSRVLMNRLPAGTSIDVLVETLFDPSRSFKGFIQWRRKSAPDALPDALIDPRAEWLPAPTIWAIRIPDDHPFVKANGWARNQTLLSFMLPASFSSVNSEVTIALAACAAASGPPQPAQPAQPAHPEFATRLNAPTSTRWFCTTLTVAFTGFSYLAIAFAYAGLHRMRASPEDRKAFTLDPVVLTAGWDGRASPAKLQVLFFSLIVIGLLTYILSRAGLLSDLSQDVLLLLGISSVGALAAHGTDLSKNRLAYPNWAWLVRRGGLTMDGIAGQRSPHWSDLFTRPGEFDVSRFQLVFFSIVVGAALLFIGLTDLATFTVPQALLELLGLSQATYVLGKTVVKNDVEGLNKAIVKLRRLEDAFVLEAGNQPDPKPEPPHGPGPPPPDIASAKRRAAAEYDLYFQKEEEMRTMFKASYGVALNPFLPRFK